MPRETSLATPVRCNVSHVTLSASRERGVWPDQPHAADVVISHSIRTPDRLSTQAADSSCCPPFTFRVMQFTWPSALVTAVGTSARLRRRQTGWRVFDNAAGARVALHSSLVRKPHE